VLNQNKLFYMITDVRAAMISMIVFWLMAPCYLVVNHNTNDIRWWSTLITCRALRNA